MSPGFKLSLVFRSPVRIAGPWVSRRIATGREISAATCRIRGTTWRTHECFAWLMFRRNTSAPAVINCRSVSAFSVAGPSVQMIFVLRITFRIGGGAPKARGFSELCLDFDAWTHHDQRLPRHGEALIKWLIEIF